MSERLRTLLHDHADTITVPSPPAAEVLHRARTRRRRRQTVRWSAAAAALVLIVGVATVWLGEGGRDNRAVDPVNQVDLAAFEEWGAVAVGDQVHLGDQVVNVPGPISAMYYTSKGVVVRSKGDYRLIRADGLVQDIDVDIPDRIPGFEPDSTRFAYAEPTDSPTSWTVVVHDAATNHELARVMVAGDSGGGWEAPPVSLNGDLVWIHLSDHWTRVNWRTSAVQDVPGTADVYEAANGRYAVWDRDRDTYTVRSMDDGTELGTVQMRRGWYAFFSPDGRFLRSFPNLRESRDAVHAVVHDVATGQSRDVLDPGDDFGWTPDGRMIIVKGDHLSVCDTMAGQCDSRPFDRGDGELRIGGNPYES